MRSRCWLSCRACCLAAALWLLPRWLGAVSRRCAPLPGSLAVPTVSPMRSCFWPTLWERRRLRVHFVPCAKLCVATARTRHTMLPESRRISFRDVFVFYSCLVLNGARLLIHAAHARETRARASVCTYPCDTRATLRPKALQCTGHVSVILAAGMHAVRPARHTLYDQRLVELATATCTGRLGKTSGNVGLV